MSGVNSSTYSSSSRLTGLYSDFDTDAMVKSMCSNQQSRIDTQQQQKTTYEWRNEAITAVVDNVKEFSNTYCSVLGSASMLKASAYSSFSVTTPSTKNAVSLTTSSKTTVGNISVKVSQLAKNASVSSGAKVSADGTEISSNNTTTLANLSLKTPLQFNSDKKLSFSINGKNFSFASDTTLQNMINTINADTDANVTMKYSRLSDSFTISADSGGADSQVSIVNFAGNAFGANGAFGIDTGLVKNGTNAMVEIDGVAVERDSNNFSIDDVSYQLNKVTVGTDEEVVDFSITRDYSSTIKTVQNFVDSLNTLLTKATSLTSAKDYSKSYPPLTDAQKEELSEDEIKAWEEKAKTGLLRHDNDLEKLVSSLKNSFFASAGGTGKSAASIGISTGGYYGSDKGKLVLDTDALTKALEANPDEVISLFTGGSSSSDTADQGVVYKIKNALTTYATTANDVIESNEDKVDDIDEKLDTLQDRLDDLAEKYYKKFSDMETALSKLNSQASYISQLFS